MTKEVGAVTGVLEVTTRTRAEDTEVAVKYIGADGRYTVEGSPIRPGIARLVTSQAPRDARANRAPADDARKIVDGNKEPVSLQGYSP